MNDEELADLVAMTSFGYLVSQSPNQELVVTQDQFDKMRGYLLLTTMLDDGSLRFTMKYIGQGVPENVIPS